MRNILLITAILFISFGCGSRKKNKSSEILIEKQKTELTEKQTTQIETESKEVVSEIKHSETNTDSDSFDGVVLDPTKDATVTVENVNGKKVTTYRNFTKVSKNNLKTNEVKKDTLSKETNISEVVNAENQKKMQQEKSTENKTTNLSVDVKRGFPWWILILLIVFYAVVSYFKGFNISKWF